MLGTTCGPLTNQQLECFMADAIIPLPPLPEPAIIGDDVLDGYLDPDAEYTAAQMRAYGAECARLATETERARCARNERWKIESIRKANEGR